MNPQKILIIQTAFLGDLLLSIPMLRRARQNWPQVEVDLVVRRGLGPLFKSLGLAADVYEITKSDQKSYSLLSEMLKNKKYDLLLAPHQSVRTAILSRAVGAKTRVGFEKFWNKFFYNIAVKFDQDLPEALRQMSILSPFDPELVGLLKQYKETNPKGSMGEVPKWASMSLSSGANHREKRVSIFPGSVWATKRWMPEGFVEVAKQFQSQGYQIDWLGSADEFELCQQCALQVPGSMNFASKFDLPQTLEYLKKSALVISNDSGGQHLAAVANTPTVTVFGPTTLDIGFRPWNSFSRVVQVQNLSCRPCGKHGHQRCPIGTHECMKNIKAEMVIEPAHDLLGLDSKSPSAI